MPPNRRRHQHTGDLIEAAGRIALIRGETQRTDRDDGGRVAVAVTAIMLLAVGPVR